MLERRTCGGGGGHGSYGRPVQQSGRGGERWYGLQPDRGAQVERNSRAQRATAPFYNAPPLRVGGPDRSYKTGAGDGVRYAGAITPVSTEGRAAARPPANAPIVRSGSIRADVARYNEERGAVRPVPHPPDDVPRPPAPSPYRN